MRKNSTQSSASSVKTKARPSRNLKFKRNLSGGTKRTVYYEYQFNISVKDNKSFSKKKKNFKPIIIAIPATPILNNEFLMSNKSGKFPAWPSSTQKAIDRFNIDTFGSNNTLILTPFRKV